MNLDALVYLDRIKSIVLALPGTSEGVCYGTPGFYVKKKLLARLKEDGETLAIYTDERDKWIKAKPSIFFFTDHYKNYPMMLIRLQKVSQKDLQTLILTAWKMRAPKRLLQEFEQTKNLKPKT